MLSNVQQDSTVNSSNHRSGSLIYTDEYAIYTLYQSGAMSIKKQCVMVEARRMMMRMAMDFVRYMSTRWRDFFSLLWLRPIEASLRRKVTL